MGRYDTDYMEESVRFKITRVRILVRIWILVRTNGIAANTNKTIAVSSF